jgi:hypothetical protein
MNAETRRSADEATGMEDGAGAMPLRHPPSSHSLSSFSLPSASRAPRRSFCLGVLAFLVISGGVASSGGSRGSRRWGRTREASRPRPREMPIPVASPAQHSVRRRTTRCVGTAISSSSTLPATSQRWSLNATESVPRSRETTRTHDPDQPHGTAGARTVQVTRRPGFAYSGDRQRAAEAEQLRRGVAEPSSGIPEGLGVSPAAGTRPARVRTASPLRTGDQHRRTAAMAG